MRYFIPIIFFFLGLSGLHAQQGTLTGYVYLDLDTNCIQSPGDQFIYDIIIEATDTSNNNTFYAVTSFLQNGSYSLNLPTGIYSVKATLPYNSPYANFCQNSVLKTVFAAQTDTLFFYLPPSSYTPLMQVDIGSDALPDCGSASYYLKYQNYGTAPATNASIEVEFDSSISILTASAGFTALGNNRYLFPLANVFNNRDSLALIELEVDIDCNLTIPGATHMAKATISPEPVVNYTGPILKTEAECFGNIVQFRSSNIGNLTAATTTALIVIEDDLMYLPPVIGPLDTISEDTLILTAMPTKMYRLQAEQFAAVPPLLADPIQWAAVEGCVDSLGGFNTTSFRQYYTEDARPHVSYDYQNGGDTLNYNQIRSQLLGYGPNRLIDQNTPLEYQIRFKNYGSTVLNSVQIRDSLPIELNLNSLVVNTTSYSIYDLRIENGRELVIDMPWLSLAPGESGFVTFSVDQQLDNPIGTVIEHRASIIMGTDTILTPMIFHTIGENFITILSQQSLQTTNWELKVYPNPMQDYANFELKGDDFEEMVVEIYNMQGQLIKRINHQDNIIQLQKGELTTGHYAYRVLADGQAVNSGKIAVH